MINIKQALEKAVLGVMPKIATQCENTAFTPKKDEPYQQFFFLPAKPSAASIDDTISEQTGAFQITLAYPTGKGTGEILKRAQLYADIFSVGKTLTHNGKEVYISAPTSVNILGADGDRFKAAVSIYFKAYQI